MRKLTVVALLALVGFMGPWAALAENCRFHKVTVFVADETPSDCEPCPAIEGGYDECVFYPKVRGTLNGSLVTCLRLADFYPSDALWGDGNFQYWVGKGYNVLETRDGTIGFSERGVIDFSTDPLIVSTFSEITGGTDSFEGATGQLTGAKRLPRRPDLFDMRGYICTP